MFLLAKVMLKNPLPLIRQIHNGCYMIIKNVPCTKCTQCGEEYLNGATLQNIEHILETLKNMLTEIAVVDYRKAA